MTYLEPLFLKKKEKIEIQVIDLTGFIKSS
jgi:hypothetical protein